MRLRKPDQFAVTFVNPSMIGAAKKSGVAKLFAADHVAAVTAGVQKDADPVVFAAGNDDRLPANGSGFVIAGMADFSFMAYIDPGLFKDLTHFIFENFLVAIN